MKLKTLEAHDADIWRQIQRQQDANKPHPNGIACPQCGKELWDTQPMVTLTSYPAQKNVHCANEDCTWTGYRLA